MENTVVLLNAARIAEEPEKFVTDDAKVVPAPEKSLGWNERVMTTR